MILSHMDGLLSRWHLMPSHHPGRYLFFRGGGKLCARPQVALATMQPENEKGEEVPDVCLQRCLLAAESDGSWNLESFGLGRRLGRVPAFRTLDALESWHTVSSRVALQMCSPSEARKPLPALPSAPAPGLQQDRSTFSNVPRFLIYIDIFGIACEEFG